MSLWQLQNSRAATMAELETQAAVVIDGKKKREILTAQLVKARAERSPHKAR